MFGKVKITSNFWSRYRSLVRKEMIPYQWNVLNDTAGIKIEKERLNDEDIPSEQSHALENFRIAAGRTTGTHYGWPFQDSDVYKWLEAVAYSLREKNDPELTKRALEVIDLIAEAQEEDGYLDTFYSILGIEYRYQSLAGSHELYCMGHFIEAAVAFYEAVGNEKVLQAARKAADQIDLSFGPEDGKIHGYDGHEEIEIGLLRLYHTTKEPRYLALAKYFLLERGKHPDFFREQAAVYKGPAALSGIEKAADSYFQNHMPVSEQKTAEGHAVRVVYLCTALADLAATTGDREIYEICRRFWSNITEKRMYITGGIGSTARGEAFTLDYDLPNDTMYCETCAAIGLMFFARQMLRIEPRAEYAEVMERSLYNAALAGMALDGKHFFYVNPLQVNPASSLLDPGKSHVKPLRPSWLGCACCPPNLARMIASLDDYIYTVREDLILVNQYLASEAELEWKNGKVFIKQVTDFPWEESDRIEITNHSDSTVRVGIRIPSWSDHVALKINGINADIRAVQGYHILELAAGESIEALLSFPMTAVRNYSTPLVAEDLGKTAVSRGPFLYCLEGADNGDHLWTLRLPEDSDLEYSYHPELLNGTGVIRAKGKRAISSGSTSLYSARRSEEAEAALTFIPYYAWANRGENEMMVWIRE
ncbi:MAG: glycoside hydrolase family 127 protein [Lachnospiraceae bacterium]|nr:glycoside hydrolase family 127 protein [Lachnospiraceae bacterium]